MIIARTVPSVAQRIRKSFRLGAGPCVDNATQPFTRSNKVQNLLSWAVFHIKSQGNIGPVKAVQKRLWGFLRKQLFNNFFACFLIGGRRERSKRYIQTLPQRPNPQVIRPEIMPPLADAMGLVYRNERDIRPLQHVESCSSRKPFWCHIKQLQAALGQGIKYSLRFFFGVA